MNRIDAIGHNGNSGDHYYLTSSFQILRIVNKSGLNIAKFAEQNGYAEQTIRNWINGHCKAPFEAIAQLSHKYRVSIGIPE